MSSDWTWRVAETALSGGLRLRYEPGTWGDVLKACWLLPLAARLAAPDRPLVYGDPFAGGTDYALTEGARARWQALPDGPARTLQAPFLRAGRLASSASLLLAQARAGGTAVEARVFDADERRRETWREVPEARVLDTDDGYAALGSGLLEGCGLVLIDPYDLDKRWSHVCRALPRLRASGAELLLYLYNRAPRGAGHFDEYQTFRRHLARACGREPLLGRLPADACLPRAWHEVLWLPTDNAAVDALGATLRARTERLAWELLREGLCEGLPEAER